MVLSENKWRTFKRLELLLSLEVLYLYLKNSLIWLVYYLLHTLDLGERLCCLHFIAKSWILAALSDFFDWSNSLYLFDGLRSYVADDLNTVEILASRSWMFWNAFVFLPRIGLKSAVCKSKLIHSSLKIRIFEPFLVAWSKSKKICSRRCSLSESCVYIFWAFSDEVTITSLTLKQICSGFNKTRRLYRF